MGIDAGAALIGDAFAGDAAATVATDAATGFLGDAALGGGLDAAGLGLGGADASLGGISVAGGGTVGGGALNAMAAGYNGFGVGDALNLAKGATGLYGATQMGKGAGAADPFASQRPYYQGMLQKLMQNLGTTDLTKIPGYQAGLEAVERTDAAQGYQASGKMMSDLANYGGNFYQQNLNSQLQEAQLLSGLSGAQFSPAAAAQIGQQGQVNAWNLGGQALNTISNAIATPAANQSAQQFISSMNVWG